MENTPKRDGRGRPKKPTGEAAQTGGHAHRRREGQVMVSAYFTAEEKADLLRAVSVEQAERGERVTLQDWIHRAVVEAVRRALAKS